MRSKRVWFLALAAAIMPGAVSHAAAAQIRFRYVPVDGQGAAVLQPSGPMASAGEQVRYFGMVRDSYAEPPRATHMVTYLHPYTGRNITVPVSFGEGKPRREYRRDRIIFNYGDYTVEAHFIQDGSVDMVYNAGFLRAFRPQQAMQR